MTLEHNSSHGEPGVDLDGKTYRLEYHDGDETPVVFATPNHAPITRDNGLDYYETITGCCRVPGCTWETALLWDDLEENGAASRQYAEHWTTTHTDLDPR